MMKIIMNQTRGRRRKHTHTGIARSPAQQLTKLLVDLFFLVLSTFCFGPQQQKHWRKQHNIFFFWCGVLLRQRRYYFFLSFFLFFSDVSCAVTDGRIVRRSAGTGGSGTAFVPCVCGSDGSARPSGQTSRCNRPTCTGTVSRLQFKVEINPSVNQV